MTPCRQPLRKYLVREDAFFHIARGLSHQRLVSYVIGDHLDKQTSPSPLDDKLSTCQKPEAVAEADTVHFDGA